MLNGEISFPNPSSITSPEKVYWKIPIDPLVERIGHMQLPTMAAATDSSTYSMPQGYEATPKSRGRRKSVSLSSQLMLADKNADLSVYTEITEHSKSRNSNSIVETITSVKTSLRVRVINQVSNLFKDVLVEIRDDLTLFEAVYDKPAVKKANIRKWGSAVTKQVKSGSHEIRCSVWDDEVNSPCHTFSIEDMKSTTTRQLYCLVGPESDLIKMKLHCVDKKSGYTLPTVTRNFQQMPSLNESKAADNQSLDTSFGFRSIGLLDRDSSHKSTSIASNPVTSNDTLTSEMDENDTSTIRTGVDTAKSLGLSVLEAHSTMRVKISNESSKRHKDLIINISSDLSVHESIYDHKCVRSAQVRKWTSDVVRGVKKKTKEVQCVVLDGTAERNVYAAYSIEDLKKLSTKDLSTLVPKSDPVELVLRCIDKEVKHSITPQHLMNSKRNSRPNHMNLSAQALSNSFSSFDNSSGSKQLSGIEMNASFVSDDKTMPSCLRSTRSRSRKSYEPISSVDNTIHLDQIERGHEDLKSTSLEEAPPTVHDNANHSDPLKQSLRDSIALDQEKLDEFKRLCRSKKGSEFQSSENLDKMETTGSKERMKRFSIESRSASTKSSISDLKNASYQEMNDMKKTSSYQSMTKMRNAKMRAGSTDKANTQKKAPAFEIRRDTSTNSSLSDIRDFTFKTTSAGDIRNASLRTVNSAASLGNQSFSNGSKSGSTQKLTGSDKISRFLEFSARRKSMGGGDNAVPETRLESQTSISSLNKNIPPIAEIEVFKGHESESNVSVKQPEISLSGDLVKQVFPYHIVIDEDFSIVQIGNSLHLLMESTFLIGKCISDVFTITGPIPSFGKKWDWRNLDKMKEKTIFLEGLHTNSCHQKPKIKGSIIELSREPKRQVMLALSPNVKNLAELEDMNLSMQDLPVHSCQRDAVLLGEHSKSEVKLTNHLDQLHRDLIDSMEKQIEDRTNELATANSNLESANAQLAVQAAKQLEHFACMSHEIRTPLNCIVGMSSLLLEDSNDSEGPSMDPMHADSIRMINTSGELLRAVVDDVLDYAKLESGSFEVDVKPSKLQNTLDSVLYSISQKVQDKNIRVRTHFSPTLPEYIETDSRRLQQVLFNLLGNAGKFSKPDSVIDLSVSLVKGSPENVSAVRGSKGDLIRFSVRDYGKGIEKKDFESIFQPFSQASKETQNIYGGTGLGLSITSKLVKRLGGSISLDSEYGKFTDFTVDLPMNGTYIEVEKITNALKDTTVVFVEPKQEHEKKFPSPPFKAEPVPLDSVVVDTYGLNVIRCNSIDELREKVPAQSHQHFSLLVHETLHKSCPSKKLDSLLGESQYSMITYGANFTGEKARTSHFKSLTALFPATLLESIAKEVSQQKRSKSKPKRKSTRNRLCTSRSESKSVASDHSASTARSRSNKSQLSGISEFRKNMKVLYAEDNLVNQKVLSRVLQRSGITDITIVDNGKKAVDISATVDYDCILLDMQMPVMDGMEACKIITERDPDTIIVFVTAHALDEFKVKAKAAGAKGFISKPFRVGDIDKVLKEIYEK